MVCKGLFDVERMHGKIGETEKFYGSVYVTVDLDGGDVMRQRLRACVEPKLRGLWQWHR